MKNISFLLLVFCLTEAFAQSNLTVFNNGGQKFYLIMNGIKQIGFTTAVISYKGGGAFRELKIQLWIGAEIGER